jgi:DNA-binding MarR family transcriptional regulator
MSHDPNQASVGFDLAESPGFLVGQLAKAMTGRLAGAFAEHGLTVPQWIVLACLWREDGLTQSELSRRANVDAATLTELLKRMTARGLVRRERDPNNNRFQRVYVAQDDGRLRAATATCAIEVNERALAGFSSTDRSRLITLLNRAVGNLESINRATT